MTDAEASAQQARVEGLAERWVTILGLTPPWRLMWEYRRSRNIENPSAVMTCSPNWPYLQAHIEVWLPALAEEPDEYLEEFIAHELLHVVMDEAEIQDTQREERIASHLSRVLVGLAAGR